MKDELHELLNTNPIKDVIAKLRFISKIEIGNKVNVKDMFVRDNTVVWQRILRSFHNWFLQGCESKESTLKYIEKVTDEAIVLIREQRNYPNDAYRQEIADILLRNLENSLQGTKNLKKTYEDDISFVARIEAYLETLEVSMNYSKETRHNTTRRDTEYESS
jgi:hypothetical protein